MNPDQKLLRKAMETICRLKGQMLKSAGFNDMDVLTYLNADRDLTEIENHLKVNVPMPKKKESGLRFHEGRGGQV